MHKTPLGCSQQTFLVLLVGFRPTVTTACASKWAERNTNHITSQSKYSFNNQTCRKVCYDHSNSAWTISLASCGDPRDLVVPTLSRLHLADRLQAALEPHEGAPGQPLAVPWTTKDIERALLVALQDVDVPSYAKQYTLRGPGQHRLVPYLNMVLYRPKCDA